MINEKEVRWWWGGSSDLREIRETNDGGDVEAVASEIGVLRIAVINPSFVARELSHGSDHWLLP